MKLRYTSILILLLIYFFIHCALQKTDTKKIIDFTSDLIIYQLDEKILNPYSSKIQTLNIQAFQPNEHWKESGLNTFFSSLKYFKNSLFGSNLNSVLTANQAKFLSEFLFKKISTFDNFTYYIISKKDDTLEPTLRMYRTNFYIIKKSNLLFLVFNEINQSVIFERQYSSSDWNAPPTFSIECKNKQEIFFNSNFNSFIQFMKDDSCHPKKDLNEKLNFNWLIIDLNHIDFENTIQSNKNLNVKDIEEKLNKLKMLYEKKIITEEEYKKKRMELIDSF